MNAIPEHGDRYAKLTVLRKLTSKDRGPLWLCGCECGYRRKVKASALNSGKVKSCLKCK